MLNVIERTRPMRSASRPKTMPPMALAISAADTVSPIVPFVVANSFCIGTSAYVKRRKSIASSIHPICAAASARQAERGMYAIDDIARKCSAGGSE